MADDQPVRQASYTTGQKGTKLKWLPVQPSEAGAVVQAMATEPIAGPELVAQSDAKAAFKDPFGDGKFEGPPIPPGVLKKNDQLLEQTPGKLPTKPSTTQPVPKEEPKAAPEAKVEVQPKVAPKAKVEAPAAKSKPQPKIEFPAVTPAQPSPSDQNLLAAAPADCSDVKPSDPISRNILDQVMPKAGAFPPSCPMGKVAFQPRSWNQVTFHWTASALCYKPNYFEEVRLARYGQTWGPVVQPFISGAHFFLAVPALPYFMAMFPPQECVYTLGYYRPGDCVPYYIDPLPLSFRAALTEAGVWTGAIFVIP